MENLMNNVIERNRQEFEEKQRKEREAFERQQQMRIEREQRRQEERRREEEFKEELVKSAMEDYGFTRKQAEMIFVRAWEEGHSCGFNEVRIDFDDLIEWVSEFVNAK